MQCRFCQKEYSRKDRLCTHESFCELNPDKKFRRTGVRKGCVPWNKGLSKETDMRVKKYSEKVKNTMLDLYKSGFVNPTHTQEYWTFDKRLMRSQWRQRLHESNPESHPNRKVAGNRLKISYPERVAYDWLSTNSIKFQHQVKIDKYFVDFLIGSLIIEIDGERFHPLGNEKDRLRDIYLEQLGYRVVRIRTKQNIIDHLTQIFNEHHPDQ